MVGPLAEYLRVKQELIEGQLRRIVRPAEGIPQRLAEAMAYSLLAPGKRLRPLLVVLAAETVGGIDREAIAAGCAVEMVHTYSLIHDDLPAMDDDDLRRGLPTCHKQFGEALAILAGDGLLTLAFQVLAESYPPRTAAGCSLELARGAGAAGMVGGQVEDLAWEQSSFGSGEGGRSLDVLENIHARKTGALFRSCLRMGVWVAQGERPDGPNQDDLARLDRFGRCFGQAFQITDDLLDVEGNAGETGKRVHKDASRGKLTYPGFLGVTESRQRAQELCREAVDSLAGLGDSSRWLADLARWVVDRSR